MKLLLERSMKYSSHLKSLWNHAWLQSQKSNHLIQVNSFSWKLPCQVQVIPLSNGAMVGYTLAQSFQACSSCKTFVWGTSVCNSGESSMYPLFSSVSDSWIRSSQGCVLRLRHGWGRWPRWKSFNLAKIQTSFGDFAAVVSHDSWLGYTPSQ